MPLTATKNKTMKAAVSANTFDIAGFRARIVTDDDNDPTMSFYFEAYDANGARVKAWPIHIPIADVQVELDAMIAKGFQIAQAKGEFPAGTVS